MRFDRKKETKSINRKGAKKISGKNAKGSIVDCRIFHCEFKMKNLHRGSQRRHGGTQS